MEIKVTVLPKENGSFAFLMTPRQSCQTVHIQTLSTRGGGKEKEQRNEFPSPLEAIHTRYIFITNRDTFASNSITGKISDVSELSIHDYRYDIRLIGTSDTRLSM